MRILRLRVKNSIGLQKGLGLSEVDLDFSGISGLIAFSGENGSSKSTCLEMLQPYSRMVSRKGSLQSHFYGRDGYKELEFNFLGDHYKTLIKIDAEGNNGRTEGYAWKNGESLLDGKISNYNKWIISLFGSPELFFNSIFCGQFATKISDMTTGQLKKLFGEFLKLERLEQYETTAKQCIVVLESLKRNIEREIGILENKAEGRADIERELSEGVKQEEELRKEIKHLTEEISAAEKDYETINETISKSMVKKGRLKDLEQNLDRFKADKDRELEKTEKELNRLQVKLRGINDEIAKCESLLKDKDKIAEACQQETEIAKQILTIEKDIEHKKKELDKYNSEIDDVIKTIDDNRRVIDAGKKDPEIARLETEISGKREKATDLKKKDPECTSEICSFIVGALKANRELPALEATLSAKQELLLERSDKAAETIKAKNDHLVNLKASCKINDKKYELAKNKKQELDKDLKDVQFLSVKKPDIAVAVSQKDSLEKRKDGVISEGIRIRDSYDKETARIDADTKKFSTEIKELKSTIDSSLDEKKENLERRVIKSRLALEDVNKKISGLKENIAVLKQSQTEKIIAEKELITKKDKLGKLVHEQSEWAYLRAACSKDGIQALEIDAVAPLISSYANDLLSRSFANNFMVRLRTQTEEGKETLDIVIVLENGEEVLLENMSGGQKIYILEALRLSLALINVEKSGRRYKTFLADENDGALSVENAKSFVELYRSAMEIGGMDAIYFISHKPEAIALANHVISFVDGRITIN